METLVPYAIWATLIMTVLSLAALVLFGARSLVSGKVSPVSAGIVIAPLLIAVILGMVLGDWVQAAIIATLFVLAAAAVALVATGVRGLFT